MVNSPHNLMSHSPPEHIEKMDWRINNLTWTTAPFTAPGSTGAAPAGSPEIHVIAKSMMKHFFDAKGNPPRWFQKCPF